MSGNSSNRKQRKNRKSRSSKAELELLRTAKSGEQNIVRELISANPNIINCRERNGNESTPLHLASAYNRIPVVRYLLQNGADINAKDKSGMMPLHHACLFGHQDVSVMLILLGAEIDAEDESGYTPLHSAAFQNKVEIVRVLVKYGALARDKACANGLTASSLTRDRNIRHLLQEHSIGIAVANGNLRQTMTLLYSNHINLRSKFGKEPTLLHLAAQWNRHTEVTEYLLKHGAEVNAEDSNGLTPLHYSSRNTNWALPLAQKKLIENGADVNAQGADLLTPLYIAAKMGNPQRCIFLLSHGANPFLRDASGRTPLEVALTEEIKCILKEAMKNHSFSSESDSIENVVVRDEQYFGTEEIATPSETTAQPAINIQEGENVIMPSGTIVRISTPVISLQNEESDVKAEMGYSATQGSSVDGGDEERISEFLKSNSLHIFEGIYRKERFTLQELTVLGHMDLKQMGISAFGDRFKIIKGFKKIMENKERQETFRDFIRSSYLEPDETEYEILKDEMRKSMMSKFNIISIQKLHNKKLWHRYVSRRQDVAEENKNQANERMLFHGSSKVATILRTGFDERYANVDGMFGPGIYFAEHALKSDRYVVRNGCPEHFDKYCCFCEREILLCRVTLGKSSTQFEAKTITHNIPGGHHSISAEARTGGLKYPEYVIYREFPAR